MTVTINNNTAERKVGIFPLSYWITYPQTHQTRVVWVMGSVITGVPYRLPAWEEITQHTPDSISYSLPSPRPGATELHRSFERGQQHGPLFVHTGECTV